jgi:hypothetical protein
VDETREQGTYEEAPMGRPTCPHCRVGLWEKSREKREQYGYWGVFECKISRCSTCKGKCTHIAKEFVSTECDGCAGTGEGNG